MAKSGDLSVSQAGRKGGVRTAQTHGHEFYEEIGRKGGMTVRGERGPQFHEEIGHKGGEKVRQLIKEGKKRAAKLEPIRVYSR